MPKKSVGRRKRKSPNLSINLIGGDLITNYTS
jgi:hypothetical protein